MSNITNTVYWAEVASLATSIVQDAADRTDCNTVDTFDRDTVQDQIFDTVLHETIDGHQWVIYYAYNLDVLQHSDNEDYMIDQFGNDEAGCVLKDRGLSGLHSVLAYWALYADVTDRISEALDDYESSLESDQE